MKTKAEILSLLHAYRPIAEKRYGLSPIGIFGSVARGEQTEDSDVDIFYVGAAPSLITLDKFNTDLEQLLGCKVDTVRLRTNMNPLLRQRIQQEGVRADSRKKLIFIGV